MNLIDYSFKFTPIYSTLLYIANHLSYKCHNNLRIYKKNELKSTFIEIVNPKKSNIVVGVIYRHPSINLIDFNCNYLIKLLENICKEQKFIFLLGDFYVNLLNYNEHNQTNEFSDSLASNSCILLVLQPTRIRGCSYEGGPARLGGLARLGEIPTSLRNSCKNIMCSYEKEASLPRWDVI